MSDVKQGAGFRYGKVMAWGPVVLLMFAMIFIVMEMVIAGILLAVLAIGFWLFARRRKKEVEEAAGGPA